MRRRAISFHTRARDAFYYANSNWQLPFIGGYKFQTQPDVLNLDGYIFYYFMATGVTRQWKRRWSVAARSTRGLRETLRASRLMAAKTISCICRQISGQGLLVDHFVQ